MNTIEKNATEVTATVPADMLNGWDELEAWLDLEGHEVPSWLVADCSGTGTEFNGDTVRARVERVNQFPTSAGTAAVCGEVLEFLRYWESEGADSTRYLFWNEHVTNMLDDYDTRNAGTRMNILFKFDGWNWVPVRIVGECVRVKRNELGPLLHDEPAFFKIGTVDAAGVLFFEAASGGYSYEFEAKEFKLVPVPAELGWLHYVLMYYGGSEEQAAEWLDAFMSVPAVLRPAVERLTDALTARITAEEPVNYNPEASAAETVAEWLTGVNVTELTDVTLNITGLLLDKLVIERVNVDFYGGYFEWDKHLQLAYETATRSIMFEHGTVVTRVN